MASATRAGATVASSHLVCWRTTGSGPRKRRHSVHAAIAALARTTASDAMITHRRNAAAPGRDSVFSTSADPNVGDDRVDATVAMTTAANKAEPTIRSRRDGGWLPGNTSGTATSVTRIGYQN